MTHNIIHYHTETEKLEMTNIILNELFYHSFLKYFLRQHEEVPQSTTPQYTTSFHGNYIINTSNRNS